VSFQAKERGDGVAKHERLFNKLASGCQTSKSDLKNHNSVTKFILIKVLPNILSMISWSVYVEIPQILIILSCCFQWIL
jgi:hypothetical protein